MNQARNPIRPKAAVLLALIGGMVFEPAAAVASPLEFDPHVVDRAFNGGQMTVLDYGTDISQTSGLSRPYMVRTADGYIVLASAFAPLGGGDFGSLGLAVLNPSGELFTYYIEEVPVSSSTIRGIVEHAGFIYVLASSTHTSMIFKFTAEGGYYGYSYLALSGNEQQQPAVGIVVAEGFNELSIIGSRVVVSGESQRQELVKWRVPPAAVGVNATIQGTSMIVPGCGTGNSCTPLKLVQSRNPETGLGYARYYLAVKRAVGGSTLTSSSLFRLAGPTLEFDPTWTPVDVEFSNPDPIYSLPRAIAVNGSAASDEVFLVSVVQDCTNTVGVAKIPHAGGSTTASVQFGGSLPRPPCGTPQRADEPWGATYSHGRIAIVGRTLPNNSDGTEREGFLAVLDRNLDLREFRSVTYPLQPPTERATSLFDPIPTGDGRFTIAGTAAYRSNHPIPALRGKSVVTATQFRADRVFGNGFNP